MGVRYPSRFELLDGLRGIAALAVIMYHLRIWDVGHFAVMVFFVISGYRITASAESCRERGLGILAFIGRRARRIYPPYLLALVFFAATWAVKALIGGHNDLARPLLHQFNLNPGYAIARSVWPAGTQSVIFDTNLIALHLGLATLFWYLCERPFVRPLAGSSQAAVVDTRGRLATP